MSRARTSPDYACYCTNCWGLVSLDEENVRTSRSPDLQFASDKDQLAAGPRNLTRGLNHLTFPAASRNLLGRETATQVPLGPHLRSQAHNDP